MIETPLDVTHDLIVQTVSTWWTITSTHYRRAPRRERGDTPAYRNRLEDWTWHEHDGVWLRVDEFCQRLHIQPRVRPEGGYGIVSGEIVSVHQAFRDRDEHDCDQDHG